MRVIDGSKDGIKHNSNAMSGKISYTGSTFIETAGGSRQKIQYRRDMTVKRHESPAQSGFNEFNGKFFVGKKHSVSLKVDFDAAAAGVRYQPREKRINGRFSAAQRYDTTRSGFFDTPESVRFAGRLHTVRRHVAEQAPFIAFQPYSDDTFRYITPVIVLHNTGLNSLHPFIFM